MPNDKAPSAADLKKFLEDVTARVGINGDIAHEPTWDFRDVWLSRLMGYIRSLERENAGLKETLGDWGAAICMAREHANCGKEKVQTPEQAFRHVIASLPTVEAIMAATIPPR